MDKDQPSSKIQHTPPAFSNPSPGSGGTRAIDTPNLDDPLPVAESTGPSMSKKITAFGSDRRHEDAWSRTPNTTGTGAIHCRTFHCKLTDDALAYMDQVINEWLDAHPQYEVKHVTTTVGELTGKLKEPHMICQVWV